MLQADDHVSVSVESQEENDDSNETVNAASLLLEEDSVDVHHRPSFTGLKRFCNTRWSCLYSLAECHTKNFGTLLYLSLQTYFFLFLLIYLCYFFLFFFLPLSYRHNQSMFGTFRTLFISNKRK